MSIFATLNNIQLNRADKILSALFGYMLDMPININKREYNVC